MSGATSIEWADAVWNPTTGCAKVSAGCKHCYAETVANRFWPTQFPDYALNERRSDWQVMNGDTRRPRRFTDVALHPDRLALPLTWKKPRRIFVNSMSDLFHDDVPDAFIDQVFAVMALADWHTFIVFTKRPKRMLAYLVSRSRSARPWQDGARAVGYALEFQGLPLVRFPLHNVQLGVSVENQDSADERVDLLVQTPAFRRLISYEPALGPVDFSRWLIQGAIHQIIVGGEIGAGARPFDTAWARFAVSQCRAAGVAIFVKQMGAYVIDRNDRLGTDREPDDFQMWPEPECGWDDSSRGNVRRDLNGYRDGYQGAPVRILTRDRKGADPAEWPEDLRVRELI